MSERARRVLRDIDVTSGRGLEIGPLHSPFVAKSERVDVVYVDVHPTEVLRGYYAKHPGFPIQDIVEVDYSLLDGDTMRGIAEVTAGVAPFHWVVASHVIEHVPDMIGWLSDVATVLTDGGLLSLIIPDRRYTFDALRPPTTLGQALQAHHDRDIRPSVRAVFDHHFTAVKVPPKDKWDDDAPLRASRIHDLNYVQEQLELAKTGREYIDCHVWVWTPQELLDQLRTLAALDLCEFTVCSIIPTPDNDIEFFLTLQRIPRTLGPLHRRQLLTAGHPTPAASPNPIPTALAHQRVTRLKNAALHRTTAAIRHLRRT